MQCFISVSFLLDICNKRSIYENMNINFRLLIFTTSISRFVLIFTHTTIPHILQEAQLSPRDREMRRVNWNLANCHATVQKLLIRQVLTKSMAWSWRFIRRQRQSVIDNVLSTMTRPSRFHCLRCVINKPTTDYLCISPVYRRLAVAKFSMSTM